MTGHICGWCVPGWAIRGSAVALQIAKTKTITPTTKLLANRSVFPVYP